MIATLGKSQMKRALSASLPDRPGIAGRPTCQPPCSLSAAMGVVHIPVYMPVPCQRRWASMGETFTLLAPRRLSLHGLSECKCPPTATVTG